MVRKSVLSTFVWMAVLTGLGAMPGFASITYTCAPNIDTTQAGTCAFLNSSIGGAGGVYGTTFTNANANIYIQFGSTGLGASDIAYNFITYSQYVSLLGNTASADQVDSAAMNALDAYDSTVYGSGNVAVSTALGTALGATGLVGVDMYGDACLIGNSGCYDGVITISNNISQLYFPQNGGTIGGNQYDFSSVVQHETDEVLGTTSCITTATNPLSDTCGAGNPSAIDLFRYSAAGSLVADSSLSTTAGPYFSYDGGVTNGADGAIFNAGDNGLDYADFTNNCQFVQDAYGCAGQSFSITTDGNAEINMLDAVGYNTSAPEPSTTWMLGGGLLMVALLLRRRRAGISV